MQSSKGKWIRNMLIVVLIPTVIFILLLIAYPQNISLVNVPKLLSQAIAPAILAWGVSFCLVSGNWDFSVGAAQLMAAIIGGNIALKLDLGFFGVVNFCHPDRIYLWSDYQYGVLYSADTDNHRHNRHDADLRESKRSLFQWIWGYASDEVSYYCEVSL